MKPLLALLWVAASFGMLACSDQVTPDSPTDGGHVSPPMPDARPMMSCADSGVGTFLPCDVEAIVAMRCRRCHDEPAALESCVAQGSCMRAPFPLKTWADTRRNLGGGARVIDFLAKVVESGEMPYQTDSVKPPVEKLTADEKATLVSWARACAPAATTACAP